MSKIQPGAKDTEAAHPKETPCARDIMTRHVHTIEPETDLYDVAKFLLKHEVSNVPVVRQEGNQRILLGFISEADCLEHLANGVFYGSPALPQNAETIMRRHPVCVGPDEDIFTLTSIFVSHNYRHLPVVERENLLGIVSRRDLIRALDRYYQEWSKTRSLDRFPVNLREVTNMRFVAGR